MTLRTTVIGICLIANSSYATAGAGCDGFLPPNNLHLEDDINRKDANMTEAEFNATVDRVLNFYQPIVEKHGAKIINKKSWTDSTVNAYASQSGNNWTVAMFGGLARRPEVTADGFSMVVCHELGHHLAGYSFKTSSGWAANEGQSDYFATQACAREIWGSDKEANAVYRERATGVLKDNCDKSWANEDEQNLCYRTALAGIELANLLSVLNNTSQTHIDTPSTATVNTTDHSHPEAQCRLDTYFQGALCAVNFDSAVIPGRKHSAGQSSAAAEADAMKVSCSAYGENVFGARPRCWFKPKL